MKRLLALLALMFSLITLAESKEVQGQPEEKLLLTVGDTAIIAGFRITLESVNDDGCGRARECYWIQFRDATFHIWQRDKDWGEITLSRASREDSKPFVQLGDYYLVLEDALGYETDLDTAEFIVTKTPDLYLNQY